MVKLTADSGEVLNSNTVSPSEQSNLMIVYLAYAEDTQRQHYLTLQVVDGTTLYEALNQAGWLTQFDNLARWCNYGTS